ncbi:hypothetical protein AJ80_03319 [Polytolypa hystricis UAMH7299]|uniref:Cyclase n=1 Tax=Polytolypa hystricis (strain UAMH7299) TaxID=1447883 RepID=A0A2B7YKN2_POLH7|nr:hypothetical protein AJ80_03319 [Polytolypa hystricis UAMH7299]
MAGLIDFDSLPKVEGQPQGNAWGLWGHDDQIGTLNKISPEAKVAAAQEVKVGKSVSLDLPLDHFGYMVGKRLLFKQNILDFGKVNGFMIGYDDELHFNTQSSSQWDGLRHYALQESGLYYNGLKHEDILEKKDGKLGTHHWVEAGGIVGRGVLIDYARWREETGQKPIPANSTYGVTVEELKAVAKHQNLEFKAGDILILRTGFTLWHAGAAHEDRVETLNKIEFMGVQRSREMVKFLWNNHFSAVATDSLGFEECPLVGDYTLHEWILAHWGMPLGELWNLEPLSKLCAEQKRWSFLFSSAPLYVPGGVGTPPNAIAML